MPRPWPDGGNEFEQRAAIVTLPGRAPLRVVAVHVMAPVASVTAWHHDLERLADFQLAHRELPLIMAGDFNAGTGSPALRSAASGLADAAWADGPWPAPTWPSSPTPVLQLDHAFTHALDVSDVSRFNVPGTDHRGLLVTARGPSGN